MKRMTNRAALAAVAVLVTVGAAYAVPLVTDVVMTQRTGTRIVDITYTLADEAAIVTLGIETNGVAIPDSAVTRLTGAVCKKVEMGSHTITWNAGADWPENLTSVAKAKITAWSTDSPPLYMMIDLSAGHATNNYPVSYYVSALALPDGGLTNDLYRTVRLAMRRVRTQAAYPENGVFMMGSPIGESHRTVKNESWREVTLTHDYYVGVFSVTQSQWQQVMNKRPSHFNNVNHWMTRPVEMVCYWDIRGKTVGAEWPSSDAVDETSFLGRLRDRTGLATFNLPTEAQWEYACRAGTSGALNSGTANITNASSDAQLNMLDRYQHNGGKINGTDDPPPGCDTSNGTAKVGSFPPNAWGLYNMHGNVHEWCLDWYIADLGNAAVTDPQGPTSASYRVERGGSWNKPASDCRSASRREGAMGGAYHHLGFRLVRNLP